MQIPVSYLNDFPYVWGSSAQVIPTAQSQDTNQDLTAMKLGSQREEASPDLLPSKEMLSEPVWDISVRDSF